MLDDSSGKSIYAKAKSDRRPEQLHYFLNSHLLYKACIPVIRCSTPDFMHFFAHMVKKRPTRLLPSKVMHRSTATPHASALMRRVRSISNYYKRRAVHALIILGFLLHDVMQSCRLHHCRVSCLLGPRLLAVKSDCSVGHNSRRGAYCSLPMVLGNTDVQQN